MRYDQMPQHGYQSLRMRRAAVRMQGRNDDGDVGIFRRESIIRANDAERHGALGLSQFQCPDDIDGDILLLVAAAELPLVVFLKKTEDIRSGCWSMPITGGGMNLPSQEFP